MTELIDIITESRKNIDKTKVCSRHKRQASPQFLISLFFLQPSPSVTPHPIIG